MFKNNINLTVFKVLIKNRKNKKQNKHIIINFIHKNFYFQFFVGVVVVLFCELLFY